MIFLSSSNCSLPRETSAAFSNTPCQFFLLFLFRKKGFRLFFSSDTSLSYLLTSNLYYLSVLLLLSLQTFWVLVSHMYHLNWIMNFPAHLQHYLLHFSESPCPELRNPAFSKPFLHIPRVFTWRLFHQRENHCLWGSWTTSARLFVGFVLIPFAW